MNFRGLLTVFLLLFCARGQAAKWQQAAPANVDFTVLMPGKPQAEKTAEKSEIGDIVVYRLTLSKEPIGYVAGYNDLLPESTILPTKALLDEFCKGMTEDSTQILGDRAVVAQNYPGRIIKFKDADGLVYRAKIVFAGARVYFALGVVPAKNEKSATPSIDKFLDSFQLQIKSQPKVAQWKPFAPAQGSFSVSMPGVPTQKQYAKAAKLPLTTQPYVLCSGSVLYMTMYQDMNDKAVEDNPDQALIDFQAGLLEGAGNPKLLSSKNIALGEWKGREIKFLDTTGLMHRTRFYAVKQRMYVTTAAVAPEREKALTPDIEKFLNSFEVVAAPQAAAPAVT